MANNIIDKIQISGQSYNVKDSSAATVVELTQQEYDDLPSSAKTGNTLFVITDAQAGDLTNYYTKSETNTLLGGKQAKLVSGTNIKTINNESILGSGNIDIQGGSTYTAGRGISIANDTISFSLPISAGTGSNNLIIGERTNISNSNWSIATGYKTKAQQSNAFAQGYQTDAGQAQSHAEGYQTKAYGVNSHSEGRGTSAMTLGSHTEGLNTRANNEYEHSQGWYNVSNKASSTFGDSGNTLFSVGNGTADSARHNAFEIRQNGDIYLTKDGQDVKLQDQLGGSSITVDTALNSGSTNPVENRVIYNKIDEVEQVTARALNELNDAVSGKQDTLVSGTNIKTINNQSLLGSGNIDIQGGGGGTVESAITSGSTNAVESKAIWSATTFNKGVLLTFDGNRRSTNYPEGCGKIKVENIGSYDNSDITFRNDRSELGYIRIKNFGNISVDTSHFEGATYEISGTTVIISYPSNGITSVIVDTTSWTYTAVVEGAWMNENTYMNVEVDAIASGLQNNINSKLDATAYTPTVVDSALNVASTNPVQNQVLYPELRIDNGETETTLAFENRESTNYPNGCTKLIVEVAGSNNYSDIYFYNDNQRLGYISINNWGRIDVNVHFDGATYEISGTTVIITYPTVTNVTKIEVDGSGNYVYKAIVALATSLKDQVLANTTALGGLKLVKLTQAEYNALATKDSSTLYIIVN